MAACNAESVEFTKCNRHKAIADFGGGEISSDAGVFLLSEADKSIAPKLEDP